MRFHQLILVVTLTAIASLASAFERPFPANVKSGKVQIVDYTQVLIDGKARTLAAGARIWSTGNLTVVPNALGDASHRIAYTENPDGTVDRIWLLTDEEAAAMPSSRSFWSWFK
jgi:hypothetical protein